jgi:hypothetical protein
MSYFDDNEEHIIYGSRKPNRTMKSTRALPNCWTMQNGERILVADASDSHLSNMLAKLRRESRGEALQMSIEMEQIKRNRGE